MFVITKNKTIFVISMLCIGLLLACPIGADDDDDDDDDEWDDDIIELIFTYEMHATDMGDPAPWYEDGVWYLRNVGHEGYIVDANTDFYGDLEYIGDLDLYDDLFAPTTFNAIGGGPFMFDGYYDDDEASWDCYMTIEINNFYITGEFWGYGDGEFEEMYIYGTVEGWLGAPADAHAFLIEMDD